MLLTLDRSLDWKTMANSSGSFNVIPAAVHTTSLQNSNNQSTNTDDPSVKFSSQAPSEDKPIHYGLPCETDHMYANYADTGSYRELVEEVSHLKAMILFHLDLIQQQSESNASKDKQLLTLKHENEMVCIVYVLH